MTKFPAEELPKNERTHKSGNPSANIARCNFSVNPWDVFEWSVFLKCDFKSNELQGTCFVENFIWRKRLRAK